MGSSETEIKSILYDLGVGPYFLGTFDKYFPGFINKNKMCCAIVNTGSRDSGGVHWMAFGWEPKSYSFYMFEPYGFSDSKLKQIYNFEYKKLLKSSAITSSPNRCVTFIKSTETVQGPKSAACGLFCILFLKCFIKYPASPMANPIIDPLIAVPNEKMNDPSVQNILYQNQMYVYSYLQDHSPYFAKNSTKIKQNTAFDKINF
ncbi:protease [Mastadenovirus eidoli]|uniref:Protease n=1 Tax=Eidolon helvum adenovirus TaxID=2039267 RepID=A0A348FKG9_9ADEN|nr:protease [Eidolon helvum adenovirus]BBF72836.1 protease [Eidolon helvum adenovirus]